MKKLLILLFILTTFLFLTACDKDTPTDESSSETSKVEETTTVEETTDEKHTEDTVVFADPKNAYYEIIFSGDDAQYLERMSSIVYTDYESFSAEIADKYVKLNENFSEKIFESNCLLITKISFTTGGYDVYGYHDFVYNEENNTMSIIADIRAPRSDEAISPASTTIYHINIIPRDMLPKEISSMPLEIKIEQRQINYDFHQIECNKFNDNDLPKILGSYNELLSFAESYVTKESQKSLLLSKINEEKFENYFVMVMPPESTQFLYDRVYRNLCIKENNVAIFADSIYGTREIEETEKIKSDFILVPREFYSENIESKSFHIYKNQNNQVTDPEPTYYETVFSGTISLGYEWKGIYTDYQELANEAAEKNIELKDNFSAELFENNYLVVQSITASVRGYSVIGYYDFSYNAEEKTMSICLEMEEPKGDIFVPAEETFCDILIIPKELFPTNIGEFSNIQIK